MRATSHELGHGDAAGLYYVNVSQREAHPRNRDGYYTSDSGGVWWSSGNTIVAHDARIDKASFRGLCAGRNPADGGSLVRGAGERHRAGWDFSFSAPRTLSILWAKCSVAERADDERIHARAVSAALSFIQRQQLVEVRRGPGGTIGALPTDVIIGRFPHYTSRERDPQIHTHCVLMNVGGWIDGKHRTLEPDAAAKWVLTIGAAYRAELSESLSKRGFRMREAGRGPNRNCRR